MSNNSVARKRLWDKGHRYCAYCGIALTMKQERNINNMLTVDHVIPRINGGITQDNNIVAACKKCNTDKGERLMPQKFSTRNGRSL